MPSLAEAVAEVRFALALPGFFRRRRISLDEARSMVRQRLADREGMFLRLATGGIFNNPRSPYLWLLRRAGISQLDLDVMLQRDGLEATLVALRAAGVYVTFEEFKGRKPIVRDGAELPVTAHSFDNPARGHHVNATTSGSSGSPARLAVDLENIADRAPGMMVSLDAHGVLDCPQAMWRSILPAIAAISSILRGVLMGNVAERWFSPLGPDELSAPWKNRLATEYIIGVGRLAGAPLPRPEYVPFDQAVVVARWAKDAVARRGRALVRGHVSSLTRIALAAEQAGIDLTGTVLWGGGEPPTPSKVAPITRSGATYRSTYFLSEAGAIGLPCCDPVDPTDVHLMADAVAAIGDQPWAEQPRQMLWLTSLLSTTPKVMLNVESDDVVTLDQRRCGCTLEAAGFATHLRQIGSLRKVTSEGMTLHGIDVMALVEDFMPSKFGGSALHYQLAEEEDAGGKTRVVLIIDPSIDLPGDEAVEREVLDFLRSRPSPAPLAATTWNQASSLIVRRQIPRWSAQAKLPLLQTLRRQPQERNA
ncbi:MAG: hypothetical protein ACXV7D_08605 [Thermoanaerobaculia bacterium]